MIYRTLQQVGLKHDEGPDVGGAYGPYIQSERKDLYKPYAEQLVREGKAYYCFCTKERLESIHAADSFGGYDRHCRDLPAEEVQRLLDAGTPYVIRQKMPLDGATSFEDAVYGTITIENKEIEDQILLKSDGYPTYNFANVIDDHLMHITHVVRGCEYLTSTPKYNLLYERSAGRSDLRASAADHGQERGRLRLEALEAPRLDELPGPARRGLPRPGHHELHRAARLVPEGQPGDLHARGARKGVLDRRHQQVAGRFRLRQAAVVQRRIHPQHGRGDVPRKRDAVLPRGVRRCGKAVGRARRDSAAAHLEVQRDPGAARVL